MKKLLLVLLLALAIAYHRLARPPVMDGSAWDVRIKPDFFFSFSRKDTLFFQDGILTAAGYVSKGFLPATYVASSLGGAEPTEWEASLPHHQGGVLEWHGRVRGDRIDGTVLWRRTDGRVRRFTFRGSRRAV